jgi:hypothetical protein
LRFFAVKKSEVEGSVLSSKFIFRRPLMLFDPRRGQDGPFWKLSLFPILLPLFLLGTTGLALAEDAPAPDEKKAEEQKIKEEMKVRQELEKVRNLIHGDKNKKTGVRNRFTDRMWVSSKGLGLATVEGDVALSARVDFDTDKKGKREPLEAHLRMTAYAGGKKFRDAFFELAVDGKKLDLTHKKYKEEKPEGLNMNDLVYQVNIYELSLEDFKKLAQGGRIFGQLKDTYFEVNDFQKSVLRELYEQVTSAAPEKKKGEK